MKLGAKQEIKNIILTALDLYNQYLNHHSIMQFFRRDVNKGNAGRRGRVVLASFQQ